MVRYEVEMKWPEDKLVGHKVVRLVWLRIVLGIFIRHFPAFFSCGANPAHSMDPPFHRP